MATWRQTNVAVKILLSTSLDMYGAAAARQALTFSSPVLASLQKVLQRRGEGGETLRGELCVAFGPVQSPPATIAGVSAVHC